MSAALIIHFNQKEKKSWILIFEIMEDAQAKFDEAVAELTEVFYG